MRQPRWIELAWCAAVLLLALPLAVRACVLLYAGSLGDVVEYIYDDGYYYLAVAANLADTGRSTFDGATLTNGYQPLWLLVLAGLGAAVGTKPRVFFVASCVLIYAIAMAAPLLALAWRHRPQRAAAFAFCCGLAAAMMQEPNIFVEGLEPILMAPLMLPLVLAIESPRLDGRGLRLLSAVLAVAFLVRLDSLALLPPLIVAFSWRQGGARVREVALGLCTILVPTVIVYVLVNEALFGLPVPVSGLAKLIGGRRFSNWGVGALFFDHWKFFLFLAALLLPLETIVRRTVGAPAPLFLRSLCVVGCAALTQYVYYAAFSAWNVWPWYRYLIALGVALAIARIVFLAAALGTLRLARWCGAAALIALACWDASRSLRVAFGSLPEAVQARVPALHGRSTNGALRVAGTVSFNQASLAMLAEFFAARPRPGTQTQTQAQTRTLIAMGDRAGGLGYWGRERVAIAQTEGLLLDAAYIEARKADAGEAYFERLPIELWVVDREVIATARAADGHVQFVVPDPIQGRITTEPVPTFCFPEDAVRYARRYRSQFGVQSRTAFLFAAREPCAAGALEAVRGVERGIGLRRQALPSEYAPGQVAER